VEEFVVLTVGKDVDEVDAKSVGRRSREHIMSTLQLNSDAAADVGVNCIACTILRLMRFAMIVRRSHWNTSCDVDSNMFVDKFYATFMN